MKTKVSIVRCNTYNPEEVQAAAARAFELIGGLSSFVKSGERVLIKPNMLSGRPPEDGVNTHIEVIRAVVRMVKREGAVPLMGDNPGGSIDVVKAYESSGILAVAQEEGVECKGPGDVKIVRGMPISAYFFKCDKIISLPKMKTHSLMSITGAVKNMFGAVSGLTKSECHRRFPAPEEFKNLLVDVFEIVKPHLVLADSIVIMDGDGPAAGRLRQAGLLMASQDSVAVDTVFSHLIGIDPFEILTTQEAYVRKLGEAILGKIDVEGERISDCFIKDFRLPSLKLRTLIPKPGLRLLASFVRFGPYINQRLCKKCNICSQTCPVSAITINEKVSVISRRKCIRCMCCHEVCPYKAIELKRNLLARVLGL